MLKIKTLKGEEILSHIDELGTLRIQVFKEYPYLYNGDDIDYEREYLHTYAKSPDAILVLVFNNDLIVGASTAILMKYASFESQKPFIDSKMDISTIFYLGESVVLPQYRGQGIYQQFFKERETAARNAGCHIATFCAVVRAENSPHRPNNYKPLDSIWEKYGYQKHPELITYYEWKEFGEHAQTAKPMVFWLKNL